jgi:hypothetical protein
VVPWSLGYPRGNCLMGCNGEMVGLERIPIKSPLVTLIQRPLRPTLRTQGDNSRGPRSATTGREQVQQTNLRIGQTHSITSSASAISDGGTSKRSARAVLRLITNSNLVACMIGKSAGLAPLRIRAAYSPTCREVSARGVP